ncbi:MAG: hypothetical protein ACK5LT_01340 [Lachnospirales bacterium]
MALFVLIIYTFIKYENGSSSFYLDGVQYGILANSIDLSSSEQEYTNIGEYSDVNFIELGTIAKEVYFLNLVDENFEAFKIPVGSKVCFTEDFMGEEEHRLFLKVGNIVLECYPDISTNNTFEKYGK